MAITVFPMHLATGTRETGSIDTQTILSEGTEPVNVLNVLSREFPVSPVETFTVCSFF